MSSSSSDSESDAAEQENNSTNDELDRLEMKVDCFFYLIHFFSLANFEGPSKFE